MSRLTIIMGAFITIIAGDDIIITAAITGITFRRFPAAVITPVITEDIITNLRQVTHTGPGGQLSSAI